MTKPKKPFNPFDGCDEEGKKRVWKEISKNGTSMRSAARSQPEMIEQLRAIAAEEKRKKQSSS